jgi:hypothetical protein
MILHLLTFRSHYLVYKFSIIIFFPLVSGWCLIMVSDWRLIMVSDWRLIMVSDWRLIMGSDHSGGN